MSDDKYILEAALFAAGGTVSEADLKAVLPNGRDFKALLGELQEDYSDRGVQIVSTSGGWALRTNSDASDLASILAKEPPRLTRAGFETLAVISVYEPVTRSEIERVRGVTLSPGVIDQLLAASMIKLGPRRDTPGKPLTFVVTSYFFDAFDIRSRDDLLAIRKMDEDGLSTLPAIKSMFVPGPIEEEPADDD